jgi:23S rRNA U2552 (ribose-2'-O)-methylase RlmE/FtsJ
MFDLNKSFPNDKMNSFHLAEGPGGFIEALSQVRNNPDDIYVGMTLLSEDTNVPGWRKSQAFLDKNPNVHIEFGDDATGNIMVERNLMRCARLYGATMDLVTADGGFDFSGDFNAQETQMGGLLYSQVVFASALQKQGGTFILKMFDMFSLLSVQILYLLSIMYDKVYIVKPNTSRYANSERYVVAQGFRSNDGRKEWTLQFLENYELVQTQNLCSIFTTEIPSIYLTRVEECNAALGQQQMDTISATLTLIRNPRQEKIEKMRSSNIQKCVAWCQKNKVPYNRDVRQLNMFLSARNKVSRVPKKSPPIEPEDEQKEDCALIEIEQVE